MFVTETMRNQLSVPRMTSLLINNYTDQCSLGYSYYDKSAQ